MAAVKTDEQGHLRPENLYHLGPPFHLAESPALPGLCFAGTMHACHTKGQIFVDTALVQILVNSARVDFSFLEHDRDRSLGHKMA